MTAVMVCVVIASQFRRLEEESRDRSEEPCDEEFGAGAETADARTEIRAVYGGFGIAMAALLFTTALGNGFDRHRDGVALTVGVALAGMALGRAIGAARERPRGLYPTVVFLVIEVAAAAALLIARG
jgi:hypothetical protein